MPRTPRRLLSSTCRDSTEKLYHKFSQYTKWWNEMRNRSWLLHQSRLWKVNKWCSCGIKMGWAPYYTWKQPFLIPKPRSWTSKKVAYPFTQTNATINHYPAPSSQMFKKIAVTSRGVLNPRPTFLDSLTTFFLLCNLGLLNTVGCFWKARSV